MISTDQLRNAIDLYRGEVSFALPVAALPGRGGPAVGIDIGYRSAVASVVAHDNTSAPTGILGLGWSLPCERVVSVGDSFMLETSGSALILVQTGTASDGSLIYAATDYRFWKIRRHASSERWEITREDGVISVYGDSNSGRGTVDWGVVWNGWADGSQQLTNQSHKAVAWNLSEVCDLWSNRVLYNYEQVSAPVGGISGLSYTRATYLLSITAAGGDKAIFAYAEKASFEYGPAHNDPLNTWQERYQTRYLSGITIAAPGGAVMGGVSFDFTDGHGQTQYCGAGSMSKRLLMAVNTFFPKSLSLPGCQFVYQTTGTALSLGVMTQATTPEGGIVSYTYASAGVTVGHSARDLVIAPPVKTGITYSQPRFYFAEDYVVATWLGSDAAVQVQAYAWQGRWIASTLANLALTGAAYANTGLALTQDTFAVTVGTQLMVYGKSFLQVGVWTAPAVAIVLNLQAGESTSTVAGLGFAAVLGMSSGKLNIVHWDGGQWVSDPMVQLPGTLGAMNVTVSAWGNSLVTAAAGTSDGGDVQLQRRWRDPMGLWNLQTTTLARPMVSIGALKLSAGYGFAALVVGGGTPGNMQAVANALMWSGTTLSILPLTTLSVTSLSSIPPPVVCGSMIGLGPQLLRYDGMTWNRYNTGSATYPNEQSVNALTCGNDVAVRTMTAAGGTPLFDLAAYGPAASPLWAVPPQFAGIAPTGGGAFTARAPLGVSFSATPKPSRYAVFPVVANNVWSNGVYALGADGAWISVLSLPDALTEAELPTLNVLGDSCCIYQSATNTVVYPLRDGTLAPSGRVALNGQKLLVPGGTGTELAGLAGFITYSGTWGDTDQVLTLHRVVGGAASGTQTVMALSATAANTGYGDPVRLSFAGDAATATASFDGWRVAYNQATLADGVSSTGVASNGNSLSWFFNGLTPSETPALPYPTGADSNATTCLALLAGQSYARQDQTGQAPAVSIVGSSTFYWWGFLQALSTVAGDNQVGFFSRQTRTDSVLDGVTSTVRISYTSAPGANPSNGLPLTIATERFNSLGIKQTLTEALVYFSDKYDPSFNLLTPVVQSTSSTDGAVNGIAVQTWRNDWGTQPGAWAAAAAYQALSPAPTAFNWNNGTGDASSWQLNAAVVERSVTGLAVLTSDALGRMSGTVLDQNARLTVAAFANANPLAAEAYYYGCESYEIAKYWNYAGVGPIQDHLSTAQAHTGIFSVQIDPVAAGVKSGPAAAFLNTTGSGRYLFSCWTLTPTGFGAAAGVARWEIQVYTVAAQPVAVGTPITLDLPDTAGKWGYQHMTVDLAAVRAANLSIPPGTALTVALIAYNQKASKSCWVDELRFQPLDAVYQATVYDTSTWLSNATLGANGATMRNVRDTRNTIIAVVGPDENVAGLASFTYARSLTSDGSFDPSLPNSRLTLGSADPGVYYDFDPSDAADWTLPNASWSITSRQLVYTGTSAPADFSQAQLTAFSHGNYAAQVIVQRTSTTRANVRFGAGNVYVTWTESTGTWTLWAPLIPQGAPQAITRLGQFGDNWCFIVVEQLVLFYADGLQVFCYTLPSTVFADGKLILGLSDPGAFSELVVCVEPRVSVEFIDGAGKTIQSLALRDGQTVVAGGVLFDTMQRPQYGKDPVSNALVIGTSAGDEQNRLIGNIGSYLPYEGGNQLTLAQYVAPANQYPFTQTLYEATPLSRILEQGQPGTNFAVGSGHATRFAYGCNQTGDPLSNLLPAGSAGQVTGSYYKQTLTDPNNVLSYQMVNQSGQVLAKLVQTAAGVYQTTMFFYDGADRLTSIRLPNYFNPPAGSTATPWVITQTYNFLGLLTSRTTPDSGQTQYAYDSASRLRFVMDADGAAQTPQRFKYFKYDALDRVIETGTLQKTGLVWVDLAAYVNQQTWPDASVSPSIYNLSLYDTDGSNSDNLEGRLWQLQTCNSTTPDSETFTYNRKGDALTRATKVVAYSASTYQSAAHYNNLGQPILQTYPRPLDGGGAPIGTAFQVTYFYDRLGQLAGVGQTPEGTEVLDPVHPGIGPEIYYASYGYDDFGGLQSVQLNNATPIIKRSYTRNLAGWPTAIGGDYFAQTLTYDTGGFNGAAYYDGKIASTSAIYRNVPGSDPWVAPPTTQCQWAYQYDSLGRLQVADAGAAQALNTALSIGSAGTPVSYDANGNLLSVPRGPATESYSYQTGTAPNLLWDTNRVQTVTATTNTSNQFQASVPGWSYGASNGGPSSSAVVAPTGSETLPPGQALQLAGGSPGCAEYLQFVGYLAMGGRYQLAFWFKTPDTAFAGQIGAAGWYLRLFTAAGQIVDTQIYDASTGAATWTQVAAVSINTQAVVDSLGLDSVVVDIALVFVNGKSSGSSAPGAALQVADVTLSGSAPSSSYSYASPNGSITSTTGRHLTSISYHPLTSLTTGITVSGDQAKSVSYQYGIGSQRSAEICTYGDGATVKTLELAGPTGQPLARRVTRNGVETASFFLHGAEGLLAQVPADAPATTRYALNDHLGSTRVLVDQTGKVLQTLDYGPFGETIQGPSTLLQPFAYTGQPFDEATGLCNYQARLYDPALRRFYAPDPAGQYAGSYTYCNNDPINLIDSTGMVCTPRSKELYISLDDQSIAVCSYPGLLDKKLWPGTQETNLSSPIIQFMPKELNQWMKDNKDRELARKLHISVEAFWKTHRHDQFIYPLKTSTVVFPPLSGEYMYVVRPDKQLVVVPAMLAGRMGNDDTYVRHSQLADGGDVYISGGLYFFNDIVIATDESGHYQPELERTLYVAAVLKRMGYRDVYAVNFKNFSDEDRKRFLFFGTIPNDTYFYRI